jgi:hypothetical protein
MKTLIVNLATLEVEEGEINFESTEEEEKEAKKRMMQKMIKPRPRRRPKSATAKARETAAG